MDPIRFIFDVEATIRYCLPKWRARGESDVVLSRRADRIRRNAEIAAVRSSESRNLVITDRYLQLCEGKDVRRLAIRSLQLGDDAMTVIAVGNDYPDEPGKPDVISRHEMRKLDDRYWVMEITILSEENDLRWWLVYQQTPLRECDTSTSPRPPRPSSR